MNLKDKLILLLKTSRPIFWIVQPLVFLISLFISGAALSSLSIIQLILLSFPYCIFLYGINDVYDYESDKLNPRKGLVEGIKLKPKYHDFVKRVSYWMIGVLMVVSILTFNFTSLLISILLLLLCEIFKNGTALQEEYDLTV